MPTDIELETLERRGSLQSDPERRSSPDGSRLDREDGDQLAYGLLAVIFAANTQPDQTTGRGTWAHGRYSYISRLRQH